MCYRNQGTRISGDELKPWAALLCSMTLDGKKSAFLHSRAPSPEKGMQESRAMLSNLLKWCFNRPIPARSPHAGSKIASAKIVYLMPDLPGVRLGSRAFGVSGSFVQYGPA